MEPRVTVLLPTHNRADVLGHSIQSVLWQSEADFELLIVADGCTDRTNEVVAEFADPRIRFFDLPKAPWSGYANRNIALREARGRYVAYAQHDDIWLPDHVERLAGAMDAADAEWSYSRPLWCTTDGFILPFAVNLELADELRHFMSEANHIPSCCVMHTRKALERVGYWPEDVPGAADWICWHRIIETSGRPPLYFPTATTLHFRAIWKTFDLGAVDRLAGIARNAPWWPLGARLAIPTQTLEQRVFFDALIADPGAFTDRVRTAVSVVIERLAWDTAYPPPAAEIGQADAANDPALLSDYRALLSDYYTLWRNWMSRRALIRQFAATLRRKAK